MVVAASHRTLLVTLRATATLPQLPGHVEPAFTATCHRYRHGLWFCSCKVYRCGDAVFLRGATCLSLHADSRNCVYTFAVVVPHLRLLERDLPVLLQAFPAGLQQRPRAWLPTQVCSYTYCISLISTPFAALRRAPFASVCSLTAATYTTISISFLFNSLLSIISYHYRIIVKQAMG